MPSPDDITTILDQWGQGDSSALHRLAPLVYPQLHLIASSYLRRESSAKTLQATGLVSELFLKLMQRRTASFENRNHFYALSAKIMRLALIDHARASMAQKRGGDEVVVSLHDEMPWVNAASAEMLDLDIALTELEAIDPEQSAMIELRFLLGCSVDETASILNSSPSKVDRKIRLARAWLFQRLGKSGSP
jgi:RNA polymerase sigma factor (TIGR02999 family)